MDTKLEVLTGQLHEANTRIDQIENDITKYAKEIDDTYERLLFLERYSRDFNLRFYNIPESAGEDCFAELRNIIENDLQLQSIIENAHRIGPFKDDGTPRPILAKFLYCPERFRVIQLRSDMKEAFEAGKRPTIIVKSVGKVVFFYLFFSFLPRPWPNVDQNVNVCARNCSVISQH